MKIFDVVGFDNGYDSVKLVVSEGEEGRDLFPSVTYCPEDSFSIFNINNISSNSKFTKNKMIVEFEGVEYYVGEYAVKQDARGGTKNFSDKKFEEKAEIVKLLAGISLFSNESEIVINNLVLGLNVKMYNDYRAQIIRAFKDNTFEYSLSNNDKVNKLTINNVICTPQGIGAYYDQILDVKGTPSNKELAKCRFGLLDIGGKTIDAFISEGMDPIIGTDIGLDHGMSMAFRDVAKKLGEDIPYNLIATNYLKGKEDIFWKGKKYHIKGLCEESFNELSSIIYQEVTKKWGEQIDRIEFILLCGGGSKDLYQVLSESFYINVKMLEHPQFSNANGYYKLGTYNSKRRRKAKAKADKNNESNGEEDKKEGKKRE